MMHADTIGTPEEHMSQSNILDQLSQKNLDGENLHNDQSKDDEPEIRVADKQELLTPQVGMSFDSVDEVKYFYKDYAYNHGFGVVTRSSKKSVVNNESIRYYTFSCEKGAKARQTSKQILHPRPSIKTDCKAKINIRESEDGKVLILKVDLEHNHGLSPGKSRHLKSHKKVDTWVKRRLELNDQAGIPVSKNFQSFVIQAGGYEKLTYDEKKFQNTVNEVRRLRLGIGDAESLTNYFTRMQRKNTDFFYVMDLTDDGRIKNIFWADARSRALYESFSDAITFDTTYLTNAYAMPFAPFVGVNHHGQSILLGCGLLSNENMETYVWLFQTWLKCMSGVPPKAIVTDQCKAIGGAVARVFKNSKHRLCLWHIMKKIPVKLNQLEAYKAVKKVLKRIVYESLTVEEFEVNWAKFITNFNIGDHEWLNTLYENREQWVPVFVKETFWAGMSTTQRSESMNYFFKDYVNPKTSLRQFMEQYDNALKDKAENESKADFASFHYVIRTVSEFNFEKQFQEAYTESIFKLFQEELRRLMYCNAQFFKTEGSMCIYKVNDSVKRKDGSDREVAYDVFYLKDECDIKCVCRLFEFRGILCRHAISVLNLVGVKEIPSRYILARWRKDIKRKHNFVRSSYDEVDDVEQVKRYDMLCDRFRSLAIIGATRDDISKLLMGYLDQAEEKLQETKENCSNENEIKNLKLLVKSPSKVRSKGRPPRNRRKSKEELIAEKISQKKQCSSKENDITSTVAKTKTSKVSEVSRKRKCSSNESDKTPSTTTFPKVENNVSFDISVCTDYCNLDTHTYNGYNDKEHMHIDKE